MFNGVSNIVLCSYDLLLFTIFGQDIEIDIMRHLCTDCYLFFFLEKGRSPRSYALHKLIVLRIDCGNLNYFWKLNHLWKICLLRAFNAPPLNVHKLKYFHTVMVYLDSCRNHRWWRLTVYLSWISVYLKIS